MWTAMYQVTLTIMLIIQLNQIMVLAFKAHGFLVLMYFITVDGFLEL